MLKKFMLVCFISIILPGIARGDYNINPEGTVVTDTSTGLMWELKTDDGGPRDKDNYYTWQQALSYCENLNLGGYDDWRLPNRNELQSIVDYNRYNPSIDPIFSNTVSSDYWSSTTNAYTPDYAWYVSFYYGYVGYGSKSTYGYVRAVRSGQCGSFGDSDGNGIFDDGDNSGVSGDNPCTGGQTENCDDNCPYVYNPDQSDIDNDEIGGVCDNCPDISNPYQEDTDEDSVGDACDNCPNDYNPFQFDCDNDGEGDICDADTIDPDGDGVDVVCDNCPNNSNPNQEDTDSSGIGNACNDSIDADSDEWEDSLDNCPNDPNGTRGTCVTTKGGMSVSYRVGDPKAYITCTSDTDCTPTVGTCQLTQGDCNGNGIGDVCECYANFNYPIDLKVNASDLGVYKLEYGRIDCKTVPPPCEADGNNDGKVNTSDLGLLKNEYGRIDCPAIP